MTHKKKIATLAQESLLSLVLSLSLKPIIAVAVDVSLTQRSFQNTHNKGTMKVHKKKKKKRCLLDPKHSVWKQHKVSSSDCGFWMIGRGENCEERY